MVLIDSDKRSSKGRNMDGGNVFRVQQETATIGSSMEVHPPSYSTSNAYSSTLTINPKLISHLSNILANLRRKYAAAAGPYVGLDVGTGVGGGGSVSGAFGHHLEYSIFPLHVQPSVPHESDDASRSSYLTEIDGSDGMYQSSLFYDSAVGQERKLSTSLYKAGGRSNSHSSNSGFIRDGQDSTATSYTMSAAKKLTQHHPGEFVDLGFSRNPIMSMTHADALLYIAPHLRFISSASAEMQDSYISNSNNPFSFLFPSSDEKIDTTTASAGETTLQAANVSKGKLNEKVYDYSLSVIRNRIDHEVARELATFVSILAHEMSLEEFTLVETEVFSAIFSLMHSDDNSKRLAGVAALHNFIGIASSDEEKKAIKFASKLSNGLRARGVNYDFLAAVTKALGKMARGATNVDYVEFEVTRALEWLRYERSDRRLAAVLTLKELATNAPAAFMSKINQEGLNTFIDSFVPVLRDLQPIVRACAADAFAEFLKVLLDRRFRSTTGLLCNLYSNIMEGFSLTRLQKNVPIHLSSHNMTVRADSSKHGSLLSISVLVSVAKDFLMPRFFEVCDAALDLKRHPKVLIRLEVMRLIPKLAHLCPGPFSRRYLQDALLALGQLILCFSDHFGFDECCLPITTLQITAERHQSDGAIIYHTKTSDIHTNMRNIFFNFKKWPFGE